LPKACGARFQVHLEIHLRRPQSKAPSIPTPAATEGSLPFINSDDYSEQSCRDFKLTSRTSSILIERSVLNIFREILAQREGNVTNLALPSVISLPTTFHALDARRPGLPIVIKQREKEKRNYRLRSKPNRPFSHVDARLAGKTVTASSLPLPADDRTTSGRLLHRRIACPDVCLHSAIFF
jgi:hypothetical protein